jgi:HD-like signal output (HDOD) protein
MHDIGILLLELNFSNIYRKVLDVVHTKNYELNRIEKDIMGITHAEIGALLLKRWKIPDEITSMIQYHHSPYEATVSQRETKLIYLANYIANNRGFDNGATTFPDFFHDEVWFELGISVDAIPKILEEVNEDIEKAKEFLKIGGI